MRAWLLLLAVLATFQTIVQVASTEDNTISSRFITAIQPIKKDIITPPHHKTTTTAIIEKSPSSSSPSSSTALQKLVDFPVKEVEEDKTIVYKPHKSDSDTTMLSEQVQNIENNNKNFEIIEIKNIEEIERNDIENEIEKESKLKQKKHKQKNHNKTKMALKESEVVEQQQYQNQKIQKQNHKEDEETSSIHHKHHHKQQQQHQQSQHASQQQHHTTPTTSDNLTTSSSSASTSPSQTFTTSDLEEYSSVASSSSSMDLDIVKFEDGTYSVESQQPQIDAVIPDDGPRTYSKKEIMPLNPEIESSLLSLFGVSRPPTIDRSKIIIPEHLQQLYDEMMNHRYDSTHLPKAGLLTKSANTVRGFTHKDSKIDDRFPHHHRFRLYFDITSIPDHEKLKAAELHLTRDAISHASLNPRLANRTRYQILVYDITRVGVRGKREPSYLLLDNKTIRLNSTDKVSLDVQPAVDRWLASPKKNFGLLIEVRTSRSLKPAPHHHVRLRRSADEEHEHWQHKQPLLFTYLDDGKHKVRSVRDTANRTKRANHHRRSHRRKNNNNDDCRRHSLYVDFADVGWSDWIVAPPGYDAFYCSGRCPYPLPEHLNSTNHAVVQTLVNNINPGKVPKPCCVATQLEGISMLYLDDKSTVVLKNYDDMTVVGCGCR